MLRGVFLLRGFLLLRLLLLGLRLYFDLRFERGRVSGRPAGLQPFLEVFL
jgi:hypothetical protein